MVEMVCRRCGEFGPHRDSSRYHFACIKCLAAKSREWRQANREQHLAIQRRYKARRMERDPEWAKREHRLGGSRKPSNGRRIKDPEQRRRYNLARREWIKQGNVNRADLQRIYAAFKGKCAYCQTPVTAKFTPSNLRGFDHVIARANGGAHTPDNIVVCCHKCNTAKGVK